MDAARLVRVSSTLPKGLKGNARRRASCVARTYRLPTAFLRARRSSAVSSRRIHPDTHFSGPTPCNRPPNFARKARNASCALRLCFRRLACFLSALAKAFAANSSALGFGFNAFSAALFAFTLSNARRFTAFLRANALFLRHDTTQGAAANAPLDARCSMLRYIYQPHPQVSCRASLPIRPALTTDLSVSSFHKIPNEGGQEVELPGLKIRCCRFCRLCAAQHHYYIMALKSLLVRP